MSESPSCAELAQRVRELESRIEDQRTTETRLRGEIAWRRLLIDESRDAIVVLDRGAKVYEANRRFAEMLGYTCREVLHLHVWDWDAVHSREEILGLAEAVDEKGHCFETRMRRKDGSFVDVELCNNGAYVGPDKLIFCVCRDISERKRQQREKEELIRSLRESASEIKTLRGILPLCSICKKIRDDDGYWEQVDIYLTRHSSALFSHGLCPDCFRSHYPQEFGERSPG